jgi:hypothetical protein
LPTIRIDPPASAEPRKHGRLYRIEAKGLSGGNEFELTCFQQSLAFERGVTNRSPEEVRAIREACPGLGGVLNAAGRGGRQPAEREKKRAGQPTKFRRESVALVREWSESGVTDLEIARHLKVDRGTVHNWQVQHRALFEARQIKHAIARVGPVEQRRRLAQANRR